MRTLRSLMLECFLLRSTDSEFLKRRLTWTTPLPIKSELESDLRYPVNEIFLLCRCLAGGGVTACPSRRRGIAPSEGIYAGQ